MIDRNQSFRLRPEQEEIVYAYGGGKMGIAAVPGSGKTFTLAHLAAYLIYTGRVGPDQEVLVVTFTNSAVNSFRARIAQILTEHYQLIGHVGYRVRTLHGLARDIIHERPALVGLASDFLILDEKECQLIQHEIVHQLAGQWRERLQDYLDPQVEFRQAWHNLEETLPDLVSAFIRQAKDLRKSPAELMALLEDAPLEFELARFAVAVYSDYQRSLAYRGAVDFDDLVRLALDVLESEPDFLARLQQRWPYILEDEAQDSSRLQEEMLRLLSGERNWVRVGDPNQAIYTTFTTANPGFLRRFLDRDDVQEKPLSVSGRSATPIIDLANELVRWTTEEHPTPALRTTFEYQPHHRQGPLRGVIRPTEAGDPDPNPPDDECHVLLCYRPEAKITPSAELDFLIVRSELPLVELFQDDHPYPYTIAILVPDNNRGYAVAEELRRKYPQIRFEELLRSTSRTRQAVSRLIAALEYLSRPDHLPKLKQVFWSHLSEEQRDLIHTETEVAAALSAFFKSVPTIEQLLWPDDPGAQPVLPDLPEQFSWVLGELECFRDNVRRWLRLTDLPIDQLVLAISQDIFDTPADLALGHKVAVTLRTLASSHPDWRLTNFVEELQAINKNQRRFLGFDDDEAGYTPKPGMVTIATMHAAKGLEWDRVYLLSVSNYDFPSAMVYDFYRDERWFVRQVAGGGGIRLNLGAELLAQLDYLVGRLPMYREGEATQQARIEYACERLRLLYVGITRARRDVIVSWNMGRYAYRGAGYENQPALPLVHLGHYVDGRYWEE